MTEATLTRHVRMSGATLKKARSEGLTEAQAERYATRLALFPVEVWTDWLQVACVECGDAFVPSRKGHRFCSQRCSKRRWDRDAKRRRYREDPEFAAAERARAKTYRRIASRAVKAKSAVYRRENAEAKRAYMKAYYEANRDELCAKERERYHAKKSALPTGCPHASDDGVAA